jgi:hypothetical protein
MSDPSAPAATPNPAAVPPPYPPPAPKSVALPLLAIAVIVGGLAYGIVSWRSIGELRDALAGAQATIQNGSAELAKSRADNDAGLAKIRDENNASLDKLRAESSTGLAGLRTENADLKSRLAAAESRLAATAGAFAKSQQRDPDAVYQAGAEVGRVTGAHEDRAAATVTFDKIEGGGFDKAKEFDWRDHVLTVKSQKGAMTSFTGRGVQVELTGVEAAIVRPRAAQ